MATSQLSRTPVLMYHGILSHGTQGRDKYGVTQEAFGEQLLSLRKHELNIVSLSALREQEFARPSAVITFDDGLESDYSNAFPALAERQMTAHFFVNTTNVGKPGYMGWSQIREMDRTGMHIGSHGHQHVDHSQPSEIRLTAELRVSRQMLEDQLGHAVEWFAPPYGFVNRKTVRAARAAGFSGIVTSRIAMATPGRSVVPRIAIDATTSPREFHGIITGSIGPYLWRNLRAFSLYLPKQFLLRFKPSALGVNVLQEQS